MRTYVVAGATGRVGSAVAREMLALGATPRVIVRTEAAAGEWREQGAEASLGSLDDRGFLTDTLRGADGFFAMLPENVPPADFHGARRRMADAIAAAVEESASPRVVFLSAIAAALPDGTGPAKDLHYCEKLLRVKTRVSVAVLRACYFQDNVAGAIPAATRDGIYPNMLGNADKAFPMIAASDVGRFVADALITWPALHSIVDLFGPSYSIRQVADKLGAALGKTVRVVDIPPPEHVPSLVAAGVPAPLAEILAEMFAAFAAGKIARRAGRHLTGTTPIDDVIRECVERVTLRP